jgi:hypothetical protein
LHINLFELILQKQWLSLNPLWLFDVLALLDLYLLDDFVTEADEPRQVVLLLILYDDRASEVVGTQGLVQDLVYQLAVLNLNVNMILVYF